MSPFKKMKNKIPWMHTLMKGAEHAYAYVHIPYTLKFVGQNLKASHRSHVCKC
jgi:hypothetical protein